MSKKLGLLLTILLVSASLVWALPPVSKNQSHPLKADWSISENTVVTPGDPNAERSRDGNSLDVTALSETFDHLATGSLPAAWTQVDGDGGFCTQFNRPSSWQVLNYSTTYAHSGSNVMMCHYNSNGLPNNDWLILPMQNLGGRITLRYWAASQDPNYLESFEVRVSTTGTDTADFTNIIESYSNLPIVWRLYAHDLSAFAGDTFYVAFRYTSVNKFALKLDNVELEASVGAVSGNIEGVVSDAQTNAPIPGATVAVRLLQISTRTDANGHYILRNLAPDSGYAVEFSHAVYASRTDSHLVVVANQSTTHNTTLTPLALTFHDYSSTAAPVAIMDNDTAMMSLTIPDNIAIFDLDVTINIHHTYDSDLSVWLQSPRGRRVLLVSNAGGSGDNFTSTVFADESETQISSATVPFTGTFLPSEPLTRFDNDSTGNITMAGTLYTWKLMVYDDFDDDIGQIDGFSVHIAALNSGSGGALSTPVVHSDLPNGFSFNGNYPNPFNAITFFNFDLSKSSRVELVLYTTTGQESARLLNQTMDAGSHSISFDASSLTSGVYFARLSAGDKSVTRRIVLLK